MKTPLCLAGAAVAAVVLMGSESLRAQESATATSPPVPLELTVTMSDYVSKRNQALVEFNRIYLAEFSALEAKYKEQKNEAAVKAVHNKIVQLKKEIERRTTVKAGGFVLLEARWGSEEQSVDCLDQLLGEVRENGLRISVNPPSIGMKDPHYGVRKTLTVKYLWNDEVRTASAKDGRFLDLPEKE